MTTKLQPSELNQQLRDRSVHLVDVRTPAEFESSHIQGAVLIPLDKLSPEALTPLGLGAESAICLSCQSGGRSAMAVKKLEEIGFRNLSELQGGIGAWEGAGLPVIRGAQSISLERQVRMAAGVLVLLGVLLAWKVSPGWIGLSAFVGLGLFLSGITGFCGMALLLAKMPWNR